MGLADLHIHSTYSWDSVSSVRAILKYVSERTDLDVIAITDHDEIRGALEAQQLAPSYGVQVITGSEISTLEGHLLAYFIEHKVSKGLSLIETIQRVRDQGGLCVAAHPMARGAPSLTAEAIRGALDHPAATGVLVGIETFNGGLFHRSSNDLALALAQEMAEKHSNIAMLANTDSHTLFTIGQAASEFSGTSPQDLRRAMVLGKTNPCVRQLSGAWDIIMGWLPRYFLRNAGWIAWNSAPSEPIRYVRSSHIFSMTAEN
jgi:hypothetical protein